MSQKLILTRGCPAVGKSTWARNFMSTAAGQNYVNVNRDDLRAMMFPNHYGKGMYKPGKHREQAVTNAQVAMARDALDEGFSVIISDTNLNEKVVDRWMEIGRQHNGLLDFEIKDFYEDLDVLIDRNSKRDGGVPLDVLTRMYYQSVEQIHPEWKVEGIEGAPSAIIVDVDGTLADHTGIRSPYDTSKVKFDCPHFEIVKLVKALSSDHVVIIMTGRDGSALEDTKEWLDKYNVPFDGIYIRAAGDTRKDSVIKRELFDEHVRGRYNIEYVIDDRLQVIYMWRALGLRVLDVSGGTF